MSKKAQKVPSQGKFFFSLEIAKYGCQKTEFCADFSSEGIFQEQYNVFSGDMKFFGKTVFRNYLFSMHLS